LKWTNLSQPEIAEHLKQESGIGVSISVVRKLLIKHGFRRRKAQKRVPIKQVVGRNEQFETIVRLKEQYRKAGAHYQPRYKEKGANRHLLPPGSSIRARRLRFSIMTSTALPTE
jgi:transposase